MTPSRIIIVILSTLTLAVAGVSSCQTKKAQDAARLARSEAETLQARVEALEVENREIREILARANEAVSRAAKAVEEAAAEHVERIETIETVDPDWLMCPLPDELRDVFRDDQDRDYRAPGGFDRPVR